MTKLAPLLATLAGIFFVLQTPMMATALVKLGFCYSTGDCSGANTIKVTGDDNQKTWNLLNGTYEYCSSFKADPDPAATVTVCESGCSSCQTAGGCTKPKKAGGRFQCAKRG